MQALVERILVGPASGEIRLRVEELASQVRDLAAIAPEVLRAAAWPCPSTSRSWCY
jgi:hypothetical protein